MAMDLLRISINTSHALTGESHGVTLLDTNGGLQEDAELIWEDILVRQAASMHETHFPKGCSPVSRNWEVPKKPARLIGST